MSYIWNSKNSTSYYKHKKIKIHRYVLLALKSHIWHVLTTYMLTCIFLMWLFTVSKKAKTRDNTPIAPSVRNNSPRQATSTLHRLVKPSHPCPPTWINKTVNTRAHVHILQGLCRKYVRWCQKHLFKVQTTRISKFLDLTEFRFSKLNEELHNWLGFPRNKVSLS